MKNIYTFIAGALFLLAVAGVLNLAIKRAERAECLSWEQDKTIFADWYATDWQIEQCNRYGIRF